MIKTDFSHTKPQENDTTPFFALSTVLYGLNFGVLGGMTNAFLSITFFGEISLYFGQIFVLFCLVSRGLNAAIISVLLASVVAAVYANDPYLIAIYALEMLFVHMCMRKGFFLFQSAMVYWLAIGIPLLLSLHALTTFVSAELLFIDGVSRALNGLICVSAVSICCWFLPSRLIYNKYYSSPPKLSSLIFSLCMLTVTLPAMVVVLFFIWQSTAHNEKNIQQELTNVAEQLAVTNNVALEQHLNSLQTISTILQKNPEAEIQPLMAATAYNNQLFSTIIYADNYGNIQDYKSLNKPQLGNNINYPSMSLKKYFIKAKSSAEAFYNDAVIDDDFSSQPLIFATDPVRIADDFIGAVHGIIELEELITFNSKTISDDYSYVIVDDRKRVIARSEDVGMPLLSNFDFVSYKHPLITTIPALEFNQASYLYQQSQTKDGWTITLMTSPNKITSILVDYFFFLVLATFFILGAFAFIAKSLSHKITKPLVDIAENFPNAEYHPQIIRESQVSSEMVKLTHKLIDSHNVMSNFQQQLSEQVHNKTKQLRQLNKELYSIAQKDSLTQLLNRAGFNRLAISSYRNCIRNRINMSLILIDIDYFKVINDTHGHPFGDKCIVAVAKTIQKHCKRDTDIIGRYGGEEFIVMIVGGEIKEHTDRVNLIKNEIEKLSLSHNGHVIKMTVSAGICSLGEDFSIDYDDVLELSDNQLYISKREGRNKISALVR